VTVRFGEAHPARRLGITHPAQVRRGQLLYPSRELGEHGRVAAKHGLLCAENARPGSGPGIACRGLQLAPARPGPGRTRVPRLGQASLARLSGVGIEGGAGVEDVLDAMLTCLDASHAEDDVAVLAARLHPRPGHTYDARC